MLSLCTYVFKVFVQDQLWSSIIGNDEVLATYLEKAQSIASETLNYTLDWLEKMDIKHSNPVSGHLIWIDLRSYLPTKDEHGRPHSDPWEQESDLFGRFLNDQNVYVAKGSLYSSSVAGFFRLTFTHRRLILQEGLRRMEVTLMEVKRLNAQ